MDAEWLIMKRGLYYGPDNCGYTGIKDKAGRYSYEDAKASVGRGETGVTMILASEAPEFTQSCFDDLARDHLTKQRDEARGEVDRLKAALYKIATGTEDERPPFRAVPREYLVRWAREALGSSH